MSLAYSSDPAAGFHSEGLPAVERVPVESAFESEPARDPSAPLPWHRSPGIGRTLDRLFHLIRYHRCSQLYHRLRRRTVDPLLDRFIPTTTPPVPSIRTFVSPIDAKVAPSEMSVDDLMAGRICLLNRWAHLGSPIAWGLPHEMKLPALWQFQLHYHEFLERIARNTETEEAWDNVWSAIDAWQSAHPRPTFRTIRDSWHPYCISRRLTVWCRLLRSHPPDSERLSRLLASMVAQAAYLQRRLEVDLGGNHLWENARALATIGCFFSGPQADSWRERGLEILRRCMEEQVNEWGEHFERSPMYQAELAAGLQDLATWLAPIDWMGAQTIHQTARQMFAFLDAIRHPDGGVPLFGDTVLEDHETPSLSFPTGTRQVGQYLIHDEQDHRLLFDAGDLGPDHLPAHAHADLLSFELSLFGQRCIVDSGTYCYAGEERHRDRRSASHNVLTVDGLDHADLWSSFRMGRRGHVRAREMTWLGRDRLLRAEHDAYRDLGVERVERTWYLIEGGPWFSIHRLRGSSLRKHVLREYLHFHPDRSIYRPVARTPRTLDGGGGQSLGPAYLIRSLPGPVWFEPCTGPGSIALQSSHYAPQFYLAQSGTTIVLNQEAYLPAVSVWSISFGPRPAEPSVEVTPEGLLLRWRSLGNTREAFIPDGARGH